MPADRPGKTKPMAVLVCGVVVGLLLAACIWAAVEPLFQGFFPGVLIGDYYGFQLNWAFVFLAIFGALALRHLWRGSPRGPAWALAFALVSIGALLSKLPYDHIVDIFLAFDGSQPSPGQLVLMILTLDEPRTWLLPAALMVGGLLAQTLLFNRELRDWAGASSLTFDGYLPSIASQNTRERRTGWVRLATIAMVLWLGWNGLSYVAEPSLGLMTELPLIGDRLRDLLDLLDAGITPFLAIMCLALWRLTERLVIDDRGVRLYLFRAKYAVFDARWERMTGATLIEHGRRPPSLVISYRTRYWLPYSFAIQGSRFLDGDSAIRQIVSQAEGAGVPVRRWSSPPWVPALAWLVLAAGVFMVLVQFALSNSLMQELADATEFPIQELDRFAGVGPLTTSFLATVALLGVGFGLLSAYQRGGPRIVMLALWLCAIRVLPDPLLHWLVWLAIFAIMTAIQGPVVLPPAVAAPSPAAFDLATTLLTLAPAAGAIGYGLGVILGRRRIRASNPTG